MRLLMRQILLSVNLAKVLLDSPYSDKRIESYGLFRRTLFLLCA